MATTRTGSHRNPFCIRRVKLCELHGWQNSGGNLKEKIGQVCIGGCKDDTFLKQWPNWPSKEKVKQLCAEAKKKQEEEKKQNPPLPPEEK